MDESAFTNADLKKLIIPLFLEQLLLAFVGIADVVVVGFVGESAVSGVSLVNSFNTIFLNLFVALATGGAVVISQYIGRKDREQAAGSSFCLPAPHSIRAHVCRGRYPRPHLQQASDGAHVRKGRGFCHGCLCDQKRGASPFLQAWGQAAHRRQVIAICKWYNARMKYKSNNNVVYSCKYHVVFCPKYRRPVLVDGVDERFKQIAQQVADDLHFEIIEMEVMPDHVHMLLEVDPQLGIHKAVKRIKGRTSHDLREEFPWLMKRLPTLWTNSYFVSTVGGAPLAIVKQYIENQKGV